MGKIASGQVLYLRQKARRLHGDVMPLLFVQVPEREPVPVGSLCYMVAGVGEVARPRGLTSLKSSVLLTCRHL